MGENAVLCSSAAYPRFDAASVAIYTTGVYILLSFQGASIVKYAVTFLSWPLSILQQRQQQQPSPSPSPVLAPRQQKPDRGSFSSRVSIPSRSSEISRKGIPTYNLHSRWFPREPSPLCFLRISLTRHGGPPLIQKLNIIFVFDQSFC